MHIGEYELVVFLLSCMYVRKTSTWFLNCGTPNKLHVKTIKSSVWLKWQILCVYLSVESMCILFWFYSSLNACLHPRACFLLTCDHQNIWEISTATHSQGTVYPNVNWILFKKILNVVSFTHLLKIFYLANTQKLKKCIDLSVMLKNTHYIIQFIITIIIIVKNSLQVWRNVWFLSPKTYWEYAY